MEIDGFGGAGRGRDYFVSGGGRELDTTRDGKTDNVK